MAAFAVAIVACQGPELLRDGTADNPTVTCPSERRDHRPSGGSPVINARLLQRFPAGSPDSRLIAELKKDGFEFENLCPHDPGVHGAHYSRGTFLLVSTEADVFWESTPSHRIVWARAYVWGDGP
jgi:hypothetical protein